jgi:hypothetical protein
MGNKFFKSFKNHNYKVQIYQISILIVDNHNKDGEVCYGGDYLRDIDYCYECDNITIIGVRSHCNKCNKCHNKYKTSHCLYCKECLDPYNYRDIRSHKDRCEIFKH